MSTNTSSDKIKEEEEKSQQPVLTNEDVEEEEEKSQQPVLTNEDGEELEPWEIDPDGWNDGRGGDDAQAATTQGTLVKGAGGTTVLNRPKK